MCVCVCVSERESVCVVGSLVGGGEVTGFQNVDFLLCVCGQDVAFLGGQRGEVMIGRLAEDSR